MKKIKIAIFLAMYIASMLSIWYLPIGPIVSFAGTRAEYERNYSIQDIEKQFLHQPAKLALSIDFSQIFIRLFSIWIATGIAFIICHIIEKKRTLKCEQKNSRDAVPSPQI